MSRDRRWDDLYGWLGTEALQLARIARAEGPDPAGRASIAAQAGELRFVREHMRQVDPALPVDESDQG